MTIKEKPVVKGKNIQTGSAALKQLNVFLEQSSRSLLLLCWKQVWFIFNFFKLNNQPEKPSQDLRTKWRYWILKKGSHGKKPPEPQRGKYLLKTQILVTAFRLNLDWLDRREHLPSSKNILHIIYIWLFFCSKFKPGVTKSVPEYEMRMMFRGRGYTGWPEPIRLIQTTKSMVEFLKKAQKKQKTHLLGKGLVVMSMSVSTDQSL